MYSESEASRPLEEGEYRSCYNCDRTDESVEAYFLGKSMDDGGFYYVFLCEECELVRCLGCDTHFTREIGGKGDYCEDCEDDS